MRWNAGKKMLPIAEQLVARHTCHVPPSEPLQKSFDQATGQTIGRIRLKLCGPMLTRGEQVPLW